MSAAWRAGPAGGGSGRDAAAASARAAAGWLSLAAAPTFAVMALMTATGGDGQGLCAAMHSGSPLDGMAPMYVLMSVFHSAPWLRLVAGRRG